MTCFPSALSIKRAAAPALVLGLALLAVGCGRSGPLEPPDSAAVAPATGADSTAQLSKPKNPPITAPKTPFALDPLL